VEDKVPSSNVGVRAAQLNRYSARTAYRSGNVDVRFPAKTDSDRFQHRGRELS
jgi:hypothetical protein